MIDEDHDGALDRVTGPKSGVVEKREERAHRGHLERPWVRMRLIRDLATGEISQAQMAQVYGVSRPSITLFKQRHLYEIEEVRAKIADEYAGLWVAGKKERLAAYQQKVEDMLEGNSPRHAEVLVGILKAVAEELGDLPARTAVQITTENVQYQIVGIDPEALS